MDFSWIDEYEKDEYHDLYKSTVESVEINFLYVNKTNELFYIKTERVLLDEGKMSGGALIFLLKQNMIYNRKKFSPLSIIKFNIDIAPDDVNKFLENSEDFNFITHERYLNDLHWRDTITLFQELNALYIIFHEKNGNNKTKRITITNHKRKNI